MSSKDSFILKKCIECLLYLDKNNLELIKNVNYRFYKFSVTERIINNIGVTQPYTIDDFNEDLLK